MKSNNKKRILAAVLCMVMVLSSSISALASEEIFVDMEAETAAVDFGDSGEQGDEAGPVDDNTGAETEPPAESPNTEDTADGPETEADSGAENGNGDAEVSTPQEGLDFSDGTASEADTGTEGQILSEETELKQEFVDTEGNVVQRVTAKLPAGAFAAETSAVTMEVSYLDTDSANYIKSMITEAVPKGMQPGSYVFFDIQFKVNGEKAEALQPVTVTIEGSNLAVTDPKKANVFYFDPADPGVEGDKDQLAEIPQRNQLMESLQAAGESTENIEDYDLSEITFREDGSADKIIFEARKSTIYGCYEETEADSQEKPEGSETPEEGQEQIPEEDGTAEETQVEITADQVNLRTTPSPEEENVEALAYAGERYPLLESVQEGEELWYKIRYTYPESGQAAELYVRSDCAQIVDEAGNTDKEETEITEEPGMVTELIYEDDRVSVTVSAAEEGIIPEGAILKVVPITEENTETQTQYQEVAQQLAAKTAEEDKQIAGFLAYDICLADAEGNETEPNGQVKVSMNYKEAAVPEAVAEIGPENTEVTVYHLEENADGEVQNVVDMQAAEQVETLETAEEQEVETVEVVTDSFSVYAVAWNTQAEPRAEKTNFEIRWKDHECWEWDGGLNKTYKRIYLHFVDENGKDISSDLGVTPNTIEISGNGNITNDSSTKTTLQKIGEQYNKNELGVYFTAAHLDGYEDQVVTNISYNPEAKNSYGGNAWIYQNGNANWTGWKKEYVNSCHVYMVYKPRNPLSIEDQIIDDGSLTAVLSPDGILENAENVTYTWFRGDQADGSQNGQNYAPVEREVYENNKFNISEKGDKLYPAYNDGARRWYKVKLTCTIDGEKKEWVSEPYQVPYYDELQNGGFEAVNLDGRTTNAWYKSQGGVWQSTGAGKEEGDTVDKNIEVVSTRNQNNKVPYSWGSKLSFEDAEEKGSCFRFAEINCSGAGAMYQDVLTMDGEALNYWLSHRARGGQYGAEEREWDEMYLVIVPTKTAVENNLSTQENLNNFLRDQGIELSGEAPSEETNGVEVLNTQSEDVLVARICSDDQDWHEISVTAGYKPSASLTRFFFMSGKTASGSDTIGNFIDKVGFGQTLPPAKPDEFSLQLTKKIQGLTQEERKQVKDGLQFDISATDEQGKQLTDKEIVNLFGIKTINGSYMDSSPDGITLTYKILDRPIKEKYQVTIKETGGELENYTIQPSYKITVNGEESAEEEGTAAQINSLEGETTVNVEFTNTYKPKVTSITVRKLWHDNNASNRPKAIDFELYRDDELYAQYQLTASDAGTDGTSWMKVIDNLPADGTYTVKEVSLDGYDYSSNITTSDDGSVFTITNTLNWYVKKTDKSQEKNLQGAEFTLKRENQIIASGVSGEDGRIDWTEFGQGSDKDILKQLDGEYTLVETKAPSGYRLNEAGWTLTFEKGLLKSGTDNKTGEFLSLTSDGKTGVVLTVTNEMIYALPSTGGNGIFGYMISGTLLMMAATLILYKMKYKGVRKS